MKGSLLSRGKLIVSLAAGMAGSLVFLKLQGASLWTAVPAGERAGAVMPFILLISAMGAIAAVMTAGALVAGGALWSMGRSRMTRPK